MRRGQGLSFVVTFGLQQGSRTQVWCYDADAVSSVGGLTNGPSSGSTSVTVSGLNFGYVGYSPSALLSHSNNLNLWIQSSSECSVWLSSTVIFFKVPAGLGHHLSVFVSSEIQSGSLLSSFSFG